MRNYDFGGRKEKESGRKFRIKKIIGEGRKDYYYFFLGERKLKRIPQDKEESRTRMGMIF